MMAKGPAWARNSETAKPASPGNFPVGVAKRVAQRSSTKKMVSQKWIRSKKKKEGERGGHLALKLTHTNETVIGRVVKGGSNAY